MPAASSTGVLVTVSLALALLAGCGGSVGPPTSDTTSDPSRSTPRIETTPPKKAPDAVAEKKIFKDSVPAKDRDSPTKKGGPAEKSPPTKASSTGEVPRVKKDADVPTAADQPESGKLSKGPLTKDPRFRERADFYPVPVFFGTNRRARTNYEVDFRDEFASFFWPPSAWRHAVLLAVVWLVPCAIAIRRGKPKDPSAASAPRRRVVPVGLCLIILAIGATVVISGWKDAVAMAGVAAFSFLLFSRLPGVRQRSPAVRLTLAGLLWLGSYTSLAALVAHFRAERERDDPATLFGNLAEYKINYGKCKVTVPGTYVPGSGVVPRPDIILGIELPEDPARHIVLARMESLEEAAFFEKLREDVNRPENREKELFVFVHGYNNSFRDAVFRTALIARDLEFAGTAVAFSWPSRGDVEDYPADGEAVDYCIPLLKEFLAKIGQHSGARKIFFFGHSMGTRALTAAVKDLYGGAWSDGAKVKEIVLAAPDIPQNKFRDQLLPSLIGKGPRLTLYASSHDVALATSKTLNKEPRAGQGGGAVVVAAGLDTVDASSLAKPIFDLGHNYAFGTPVLRRDLQLLFEGRQPPRESLKDALLGTMRYWVVTTSP